MHSCVYYYSRLWDGRKTCNHMYESSVLLYSKRLPTLELVSYRRHNNCSQTGRLTSGSVLQTGKTSGISRT